MGRATERQAEQPPDVESVQKPGIRLPKQSFAGTKSGTQNGSFLLAS